MIILSVKVSRTGKAEMMVVNMILNKKAQRGGNITSEKVKCLYVDGDNSFKGFGKDGL